ncbi:MAG: TrmH family RNA methyltransferase [Phototrophicaceae bacterium]
MQTITSFQNSKIKLANRLVNKRQREKEGLFLIDYARDLERALANGYEVDFAFYCDALSSSDDKRLRAQLNQDNLYAVDADLMEKASYRQNPSGLVAIMRQKPALTVADAKAIDAPRILALVNLRKPGNIGALLRTADAAGIDMICLIDSALDIYNPNIIRASTGAVFLNNIYEMTSETAFEFFSTEHIQVIAAHLEGEQSLYDLDFTVGRHAIVLGTEDTGLDDEWVKRCDALVKIPMMGQITDSLNVSVSGAVFMYEALRQNKTSHT